MLTWKMITDGLDEEKYKVITEKAPEREYIGLQAMFPETSQCLKEYLYMVKPSVTKFKELPDDTSLLLIYEPGYMDLRDLGKYKASKIKSRIPGTIGSQGRSGTRRCDG